MYWFGTSEVGMTIDIPSVAAHPTEDALEEYALRRLSESDTATLEEHLLVCEDCRQSLLNIDEFILAMRQFAHREARSTAWRSVRARIFGYGTAVAIAAVGFTVAVMLPAFHRAPIAKPVQLVAFRGGEGSTMIPAEAGAALNLVVDLTDLMPRGVYRIQIVDAQGNQLWDQESRASGGALKIRMSPGLKRGVYWIRLYSGGELLREFGLRAQ